MIVKRLAIDDPRMYDANGVLNICDPTWDAIEQAICQLDGKHRTLIIRGRSESEFLVVGGGNGGMHSCGVIDETGAEFTVIDERRYEHGQVVVPCRQPTTIHNQEGVGLATVLIAAKEYAKSGQRCAQVKWKAPR